MTIFYCLRFETPPTWRARPRIYIPQEHAGPVIPPGTGFPFRSPLRLAGLRWRFSNPCPHVVFNPNSSPIVNSHLTSFWSERPLIKRIGIQGNICWLLLSMEMCSVPSWFPTVSLYGIVFVNAFHSNGSTCHSIKPLFQSSYPDVTYHTLSKGRKLMSLSVTLNIRHTERPTRQHSRNFGYIILYILVSLISRCIRECQ
jgi:hypothetical protein